MNKKGLGMMMLSMCIIVATIMIVAIETNNYNFKPLSWNNMTAGRFIQQTPSDYSNLQISVTNLLYKFIDAAGYIIVETTNIIVTFTLANPEILNWKVFMWLVLISVIAPIAVSLIKLLIIAFILIKEVIDSKKEKKKLKMLKIKQLKDG